jgi:hypothetical protein
MTYVLALQYSVTFGVELVVFNMAASYFHDDFGVDVVQAGQIAMLCGVRVDERGDTWKRGGAWVGNVGQGKRGGGIDGGTTRLWKKPLPLHGGGGGT